MSVKEVVVIGCILAFGYYLGSSGLLAKYIPALGTS